MDERQQTEIGALKHANRQSSRRLTQSRYYRGTVADAKKKLSREHVAAMEENDRLKVEVEGWHAEYARLQAELLLQDSDGHMTTTRGKPQTLSLFKNGQYSDQMRLAVFACLNANVGKDKIGPLISAITQAVAQKQIIRLPAPSTAAS